MRNRLPSITSVIAPDIRRFLDRLREAFDGNNPVITQEDLIDAGSHELRNGKLEYLAAIPPCTNPPAPTQVKANGAMTSILLEWEGTNYASGACHSHTEVWRSDTNNFATATMIGVSDGALYADAVGTSASYYYWVRFINANNVAGPLNATDGILGETAEDTAYLMDMLAKEFGDTSEAPFFQIDAPLDIDGVTIPAGTYIKSAYIHDGQITNAKIGDAAIDTANIVKGAVKEAQIDDAAITNAKIGNTIEANYPEGGTPAWRIDKNGAIVARRIMIQDLDGNVVFAALDGVINKLSSQYVGGLGGFAELDQVTADNIGLYVEEGAISNAYIGGFIQSGNYRDPTDPSGPQGWKIDKDGKAIIGDGEFYGQVKLTGTNPELGNYLELTNDALKVIVGGTTRVRIGKLTDE